jgi:hypothetical protein
MSRGFLIAGGIGELTEAFLRERLEVALAKDAELPDAPPRLEYPYYTVRDPELAKVVSNVAAQARRDLFAPIKTKGNYAEKLRQHFMAKKRTEEPKA